MAEQEKKSEKSEKSQKGWMSKLKDAIYESNPSDENENVSTDVDTTNQSTNTSPSKSVYSEQTANAAQGIPKGIVVPNSNGVFDEKFYNSFLKIIEDNNVDGMDYFEFSKAKKAMDASGLTEPVKYQAAYSTLKAASNLTKKVLLDTADFYLDLLSKEEKDFNAEMQHEISSQVGSRLDAVKSKETEFNKKQEEINKLQVEMGNLQGDIANLNMEAQQVQSKIESTAKNFKVSLEVLRSQVNADKQNIQQFIQE